MLAWETKRSFGIERLVKEAKRKNSEEREKKTRVK